MVGASFFFFFSYRSGDDGANFFPLSLLSVMSVRAAELFIFFT